MLLCGKPGLQMWRSKPLSEKIPFWGGDPSRGFSGRLKRGLEKLLKNTNGDIKQNRVTARELVDRREKVLLKD